MKRVQPPRKDAGTEPGGLWSTSLDTQQTKPDAVNIPTKRFARQTADEKRLDRIARLYEHHIPPASAIETAFRHRGHRESRARVIESLCRVNVPQSRLRRYCACGSDCVIEASSDGQHLRLRANYCGDRFCVACSAARSRTIVENLLAWKGTQQMRFLTLTLKPADETLAQSIDHLIASFRRLRDQSFWKESITAGAYFIEITRGADGSHWHVHAHALITGCYVKHEEFREGWRQASGGSYIVDIKPVRDPERQIRYVAKYATKAISQQVVVNPAWLDECVLSLRGRRTLGTFGAWRGLKLDRPETADRGWKRVGRLDDIYMAASRGEIWAAGIFHSLGVKVVMGSADPRFVPADSS